MLHVIIKTNKRKRRKGKNGNKKRNCNKRHKTEK